MDSKTLTQTIKDNLHLVLTLAMFCVIMFGGNTGKVADDVKAASDTAKVIEALDAVKSDVVLLKSKVDDRFAGLPML